MFLNIQFCFATESDSEEEQEELEEDDEDLIHENLGISVKVSREFRNEKFTKENNRIIRK